MTARLTVGCAMWAHRPWVGRWLPGGIRPGRELEAYARVFGAVEGNTTFYALPKPEIVERWRLMTPESFRFLFKLPRTITHDRRLIGTEILLTEFLDRIAPLGKRVGPLSIQLPASFGPAQLHALHAFLTDAPRSIPWSVELRHPAFFDDDGARRAANDLLHSLGVDRIVLDSRALFAGPCTTPAEIETFKIKPRLTVRPAATGYRPVVRLIGQSDIEANHSFWEPWIDRVVRWLDEGRSPTVFTHTPDNDDAPALAIWFREQVQARQAQRNAVPSV